MLLYAYGQTSNVKRVSGFFARRKMIKNKKKRIGIFIDAANIFYSQKTLGWELDYKKFLHYCKTYGRISGAYFYSGVISTNRKQLAFFEAIKKAGYTVITREVKIIRNKHGKIIVHKGNFDVKVAIDMVLKAKEFDIAILASGDSDFQSVVEHLKSIKKKVIVISARGHISRELVKCASYRYLPLEKIKEDIRKVGK